MLCVKLSTVEQKTDDKQTETIVIALDKREKKRKCFRGIENGGKGVILARITRKCLSEQLIFKMRSQLSIMLRLGGNLFQA